MQPLKGKIKEVYEFVESTIRANGLPPSVREICKGVNLQSPSSVHSYLNRLQELGYINKDSRKMRTITLTNSQSYARVPVIGRVTAGSPILAFEDVTGYICYNTEETGDFFALNVTGNSMINAGILDGDVVIVRKQSTARNGEIVIAMIDGEATVKRLSVDGEAIWLMPENPDYDPIDGTNCTILGRVCSLSRAY
ncbi:MAG: transcriptional repressor LexA [Ruminococcaceae bacterium]|nr:transcriptional repressor LexA [Oscillospiraceae bacterium]